ncbi:MAG: formate dehydrogenase subunit delta [Actinobacteria bacterium]|jgi:formate dehydrogenase subunit delta|nr:formate dehydrogenase subunit delta [Actinomycetota bacterium]
MTGEVHADPVQVASLLRMANQIASNARHKPHDEAVSLVAAHLRDFWAPSMRLHLTEWMDVDGAGLDPVAAEALERLRPA